MPPRVAAILGSVGFRHGLTVEEILDKHQYRELTAARRECAQLMRDQLGYRAARIGRFFHLTEASIRYYLR